MKSIKVDNFKGGLSKLEPTTIGDNQFEELTNFYYDSTQRVRTRKGITSFGKPIPDAVVTIDSCNAVGGWVASDDATNVVASSTTIRGSASVGFNIDTTNSANDYATMTDTVTADISTAKGYLTMWLHVPISYYAVLSLVTQPTNGDTLTIHGATITFVSVIGATAGNVFIGADVDTTRANLASLINTPTVTNTTQVALSTPNATYFTTYKTHAVNDNTGNTLTVVATISITTGKTLTDPTDSWTASGTGYESFNTGLTNVKFQLGSDSSNYYEWTLPTLTTHNLTTTPENGNFIKLLYSDATVTGTPVDTTITHARLRVTYAATYKNKTEINIDSIYSYSATSTKPVTSLFYNKRDDNQRRRLLAVNGANTFLYDETTTYWEVIDSGLTEYETQTGRTTFRTRWDFCTYKDVIYMGDGVNTYRSWSDTTIATYSGQPNYRYLEYMQDRLFASEDSNPTTLYYTAAAPADGSTLNGNSVVIGGDEMGKINGLKELGQIILVGKNKKIYGVDLTGPEALPIDAENGLFCNRVIKNVGNSLVYFCDTGIDSLKQRYGVTGVSAIESESISADVSPMTDEISPFYYNSGAGFYDLKSSNLYYTFDSTNDDIPDTTLIRNSTTSGWSEYTYPTIYDYCEWEDSSGEFHSLIGVASGGQVMEIETGYDDNGIAIEHTLKTKNWDFGKPEEWKDFQAVDIVGLGSEGAEITAIVYVDDVEVAQVEITDANMDLTTVISPLGTAPIGATPLGGGTSSDEVDLYQYKVRIPLMISGHKIQVEMNSNKSNIVWTLDKMSITYDENTFDIFPINNIL